MKLTPAEKEDKPSYASFVERAQSQPLGFTQGGNGPAGAKEKSKAVVYLKDELPEFFQSKELKETPLEGVQESEVHSLESFLMGTQAEPTGPEKENFRVEQDFAFMSSFWVELVHTIKKSLASIYHGAVLGWEKGADAGIRGEVHAQIKDDIKKIDSVLNSLLNFININTPITKSNTLSVILEDVLEATDKQLQEKSIRIAKRCEESLPETYLHPEQVRFVLHSVLQYAAFVTPTRETIWVLMKSAGNPEDLGHREASQADKGYVEVMIGFNGDRKPGNTMETSKEAPPDFRETIDLILTLGREILRRNHGVMTVETRETRPSTLITMRFPIERRKVVYYAPVTL